MPPKARPDDKSGRGFLRALRIVEQNEPSRPFEHVEVVWSADPPHQDGQEYRVTVGGYELHTVEMTEEFLADEPPQMPRVSWSVYKKNASGEIGEPMVGGAAPTIDIAKARAEALWRAFMGYKRA